MADTSEALISASGARVSEKLIDNGDGTFSLATAPASGTTQRTSAGLVAKGQSAKTFVGKITLTGSATSVPLETVTALKTLIITDIGIWTDSASQIDVQIQAAGTPIFRAFMRDLAPVQMPGIETQPNASAGQAVTLNLPIGTANVIFAIYGIEQ